MGSYDDFLGIYKYIRNDEKLLRLLTLPPEDLGTGIDDPLSPSLTNILDKDPEKISTIQNEHIMKSMKADDLENKKICRLYIYPGRRSPRSDSYYIASQELVIDLFVHLDYENGDFRTSRINDRLNELIVDNHIVGASSMRYLEGSPRSAPRNYVGYESVFTFMTKKS